MRESLVALFCTLVFTILVATPAAGQLLGVPESNDRLGYALASGDFDGDGFMDLAAGAPGDQFGQIPRGAVNVLYGTSDGLTNERQQLWNLESLGTPEDEWSTELGRALAVGDFNGDGRDDLAIRGAGMSSGPRGGVVYVVYGSPAGLDRVSGSQVWHLDRDDICFDTNRRGCTDPPSQLGDDFGFALAAGDFNGDGFDQLAIGIPGFSLEGPNFAGAVLVLQSDGRGLISENFEFFTQNQPEAIIGGTEANDAFGRTLETGDVNADGFDDLAIGSPYEEIEAADALQGGAVNLLYGSANGLTELGNQLFVTRDSDDDPKMFDWFGYAIAMGHFWTNVSESPRPDDMVVGVPGRSVSETPGVGIVNLYDGSIDGLQPSARDFITVDDVWIGPDFPYDRFGGTLEDGDFDGDGFDDLAVAKLEYNFQEGAFHVVPGGDAGFQLGNSTYWTMGRIVPEVPGLDCADEEHPGGYPCDEKPELGFSFAAGDFNMDGYSDLAIGSPAKHRWLQALGGSFVPPFFHAERAGAVLVLYGSESGLRRETIQWWYQNVPALAANLVTPADNSALVIGGSDAPGDPLAPLAVVWARSADPDSMPVTYQWQISSKEAFEDTLAEFDADASGSQLEQLIVTHGDLAGLLSDAGVALDETVTWFHRVVTHDGVAGTPSEPFRLVLTRGAIVAASSDGVPEKAAILDVYPNPSSMQTTVSFRTSKAEPIVATLHDVRGATVLRLVVDGAFAGRRAAEFDLSDLPGGIYLYRIFGGGLQEAGKIVVVK